MNDETDQNEDVMETLLSVTAENTTTLLDVQNQAATTAAAVKDARTYIADVVKNTSWENNSKRIKAVLGDAAKQSQEHVGELINTSNKFADTSDKVIDVTLEAVVGQRNATAMIEKATESLTEARKGVRRWWVLSVGIVGLLAAAGGAVGGFYAHDPLSKWTVLSQVRNEFREGTGGFECEKLGGKMFAATETHVAACVIDIPD